MCEFTDKYGEAFNAAESLLGKLAICDTYLNKDCADHEPPVESVRYMLRGMMPQLLAVPDNDQAFWRDFFAAFMPEDLEALTEEELVAVVDRWATCDNYCCCCEGE